MKRMVLGLSASAVVMLLAQSASAEVRAWIGSGGNEDWSDSANWQGGNVAAGDDVAVFAPPATGAYCFIHRLTPPASFTGEIVTSNELAFLSSSSWWTTKGPIEVAPAIVEGATWKIGGNGTFVVCEGFESHVPSTFAGKLIVPRGVSFTAPADLNAKVLLTGAGTLTLSRPGQLAQATAFVGDIILPSGDLALSHLGDLANASVRLADGQTVSLSGHDATYSSVDPIESFVDHPDKWTFNGSISTTDDGTKKKDGSDYPEGAYNKLPPYVKDGVLYLTDDPSQCHTVWYRDRYFRYGDEVGMKFTWTPALPTNPHVQGAGRGATLSGVFSVSFQGESETNCKTGLSMTDMRYLHAASQNGFFVYIYRGDNNPRIGWIAEGTVADGRDSVPEAALNIMLNKPIDFFVTIDKAGLMTVTLEQNGKSETFTKNYSTQFSSRTAKGFYVGFTGASDTWGYTYGTMPWVSHQVSNFRGWSRSSFGGNWEDVENASDFALTADNWDSIKGAADGTCVTNAASTFESDGTVHLVPAPSTMTMLYSRQTVDRTRPTKLLIDIAGGAVVLGEADNVGSFGLSFGLCSKNNPTWKPAWNAKGYYEIAAGTSWLYGMLYSWDMGGAKGIYNYSIYAGTGTNSGAQSNMNRLDAGAKIANQDIHVESVMDPTYGFRSRLTKSPSAYGNGSVKTHEWSIGADRLADWNDTTDNRNLRNVLIRGSAATKDYTEMTLTRVKVQQIVKPCAGVLAGGISVPDGASVVFKAGEAPAGQNLEFVRVSDVSLGTGATLTVAPESAATKVAFPNVAVAGAATLAAASGAEISVGDISLAGTFGASSLTLTGSASLSDGLTIVVPDAWIRAKGRHKIVGLSGAFPSNARVVTESGADVTERAKLSVGDGAVTACFEKGLMLLFR